MSVTSPPSVDPRGQQEPPAATVSHKRGGLVKTALYILALPIYLIARWIPKDRNLVAFGSCHGLHFADNSKYLFLYAARQAPKMKCVFLSRHPKVVSMLRDAGYHSCRPLSWEGIKTAVRAGTCVISHSTHDIHTLLIGGARIIQLWHGTPLKAICYDVDVMGGSVGSRMKYAVRSLLFKLFPYLNTTVCFQKIVIASKSVRPSFRSAFRLSDDDILVLGQARNDTLAADYEFDPAIIPEVDWLEKQKKEYDAIITWMPTHRLMSGGTTADLVRGYGFDADALEAVLAKYNARLIIKVHFLDESGVRGELPDSRHVVVYGHADPYPLLRYTDVLVTDYSSVYFDYLLLNRPILFTPFDHDAYAKRDAKFYYDYDEVTPGDKCRTWPELLASLDRTLAALTGGDTDPHAAQRDALCRRFNDFPAGNCRRIVEAEGWL